MIQEPNFLNFSISPKSTFNINLLAVNNLSSNKNTMVTNFPNDSFYFKENLKEKETEKCSLKKEELESENVHNNDNFLTKDINSSINEINFVSKNSSHELNEKDDIFMQDKTESYENEKDCSSRNLESDDINFKGLDIEKETTNDYKDIENIIDNINKADKQNTYNNSHYRSFSYNDKKHKKIKEKFNSSYISSSYGNSMKYLNEELVKEFPFNLNMNKSCNFLQKNRLTLSENISEQVNINNNDKYLNSSININNEDEQNNFFNFNINPSKIFNMDNQKNQQNYNFPDESKNIDNIENKLNDNNINIQITKNGLNDSEDSHISNMNGLTDLKQNFHQREAFKLNIENINLFPPFFPKCKLDNDSKTQENINNENEIYLGKQENFGNNFLGKDLNLFENENNYINFDNKNNNNLNVQNFNISNENKSESKEYNTNNNKLKNFYSTHLNEEIAKINNQKMKFINNSYNNANQINNVNNNVQLYRNNNIVYYNNYINLINQNEKTKNINSIKNNEINMIHDMNKNTNISIEIDRDNLNPENYLIKMFGRLGWICFFCNNFNYSTRNNCNRCKAIKVPKTIKEINEIKEIKKTKKKVKVKKTFLDWLCLNCQNINYGFRKYCNRCQIERKKEFPSFHLEPNQKLNSKNNDIILMKNINEIQNDLNKNINNSMNYNICHFNLAKNTNANNLENNNYICNNNQYYDKIVYNNNDN